MSTPSLTITAGGRHRPPGRGGVDLEVQSLDGSGNNRAHPRWGRAGQAYRRVAPARYADGCGARTTPAWR
ncbi:peroxidase family protein [Dactylosporangium sp. NPDC050688]|uniref:peroxidase family protein n=1 Tax=Dactylosporangium sp. NPDC050688 TaxID=3157217 RepID=UPI0033E4A4C3